MSQLNREQIEKEYIEYVKHEIDEKMSTTDSSSGIQVDQVSSSIIVNNSNSKRTSARGKKFCASGRISSNKRPSLTSIKAKKAAAKQAREQIWQI